jgi:hypothetical protein
VRRYDGPAADGAAAKAGSDQVYAGQRPDSTLADLRLAATRRLRRQRHIERIFKLGSRVVFEMIDELDRYHGPGDDLDQRLARYAAIDPTILAAIRGNQFARTPTRVVGSGS